MFSKPGGNTDNSKAVQYSKKHYESKLAEVAKTNKKAIQKYIKSRSRSSKSICQLGNKDDSRKESKYMCRKKLTKDILSLSLELHQYGTVYQVVLY